MECRSPERYAEAFVLRKGRLQATSALPLKRARPDLEYKGAKPVGL
jgi:hypothetical protein